MISNESLLEPEWVQWITENLLRSTPQDEIFAKLSAAGVPKEIVSREVQAVIDSPVFAVARAQTARLKRVEFVTRLLADLSKKGIVASGEVERRDAITASDFFEHHYARNTPVVLTGLMRSWPALRNWSPQYFREKYGELMVDVSVGRNKDPMCDRYFERHVKRMKMAEFSQMVQAAADTATNDFYLIANHRNLERNELAVLFDDVDPWPEFLDPNVKQGHIALWYGPGGTLTPLHHDGNNILFTQIYGRKIVRLISPTATPLFETLDGYYSNLDLESAIAGQDPILDGVEVKMVTLNPGEALFIPVGWWHHVRSLEPSINLSFLNFRRGNEYTWYSPGTISTR